MQIIVYNAERIERQMEQQLIEDLIWANISKSRKFSKQLTYLSETISIL